MMMAYKRQFGKGDFKAYVREHAEELIARHEAGETWRKIEASVRGGRYCGAVARVLKELAGVKKRQPAKPAVPQVKVGIVWDDDDFTPYTIKLINRRMRKSFFKLLQEVYMVKGVIPIYQKAYKERLLVELVGVSRLADIKTIEQFMIVFFELVKRASRLEDLHRLILLPRVKKGVNHA